jgi:hypothetical protein
MFMNNKTVTGGCGDNLTWSLDTKSGVLTISGMGAAEYCSWKDYRSQIKTAVIKEGVTSIGSFAFKECRILTGVTIPNGVTSIGSYAFSVCRGLTSITLPNSVTSIGKAAFFECRGLTSVTLPNSVTSIGEFAFWVCTGLTSVTLGDGVTSIGYGAFSGCRSLTSVTLPDGVTSIGEGAFARCSGLTGFAVSEGNARYAATDGVLFSKDRDTLIAYPNAKAATYVIPDGVTCIGVWAFSDCSGLTSVTLPNSVTSIGEYAFFKCSSLTSVTIPDGVTSIGQRAFLGCSGLTGFAVSEGNALYAATDGVLFSKDRDTLIAYPNTKAATYVIPDGVTCIGEAAFFDCSGLTSVTIPESVTSIGQYAFYWCNGLREIHCQNPTPPSVGSDAFYRVSATIYVPKGSKAAYQVAGGWSVFTYILEEERE